MGLQDLFIFIIIIVYMMYVSKHIHLGTSYCLMVELAIIITGI